jgi:hypothetical protein
MLIGLAAGSDAAAGAELAEVLAACFRGDADPETSLATYRGTAADLVAGAWAEGDIIEAFASACGKCVYNRGAAFVDRLKSKRRKFFTCSK